MVDFAAGEVLGAIGGESSVRRDANFFLIMLPVAFVTLGSLWSFGCQGPTGLLPGGALAGEPAPNPTDWLFAGDSGTIQLETDPDDPYSVNLAYTVMAGRLYLNAGGTETRWARNIARNPDVRLRMDGRLYDLRAERVVAPEAIARFAQAWTSQSFFRRNPGAYDEVWIFELVER